MNVRSAAIQDHRRKIRNPILDSEIIEEFSKYGQEEDDYSESVDHKRVKSEIEKSQKLKASVWSNEKVRKSKQDYDTPSSKAHSNQETSFFNTQKFKNKIKYPKDKKKTLKPSATMRKELSSVSQITEDIKFSQKFALNSSNLKAKLEEGDPHKSMLTSSKLSSNLSSEMSKSEDISPNKKKTDKDTSNGKEVDNQIDGNNIMKDSYDVSPINVVRIKSVLPLKDARK
jgi:hypothetical protein